MLNIARSMRYPAELFCKSSTRSVNRKIVSSIAKLLHKFQVNVISCNCITSEGTHFVSHKS